MHFCWFVFSDQIEDIPVRKVRNTIIVCNDIKKTSKLSINWPKAEQVLTSLASRLFDPVSQTHVFG